ncbi:hypothetical protein [Actinoplanes sp. NPDC049316]
MSVLFPLFGGALMLSSGDVRDLRHSASERRKPSMAPVEESAV